MKAVSFLILTVVFFTWEVAGFAYQTKTFEALVDHFSYVDNRTFSLRYLINNSYVGEVSDRSSPILFYTGNEGDIELFAENTGFMWRLASELSASLVFAEHRYYGKSLPFGNESYKDPQHLGYLTSEQALADYADLLQFLNPDVTHPVIVSNSSSHDHLLFLLKTYSNLFFRKGLWRILWGHAGGLVPHKVSSSCSWSACKFSSYHAVPGSGSV